MALALAPEQGEWASGRGEEGRVLGVSIVRMKGGRREARGGQQAGGEGGDEE